MQNVIKQRQIVRDSWRLLEAAAEDVLPAGEVIAPLALWLTQREALLAREGALGVWLEGHQDPAAIAADLAHFALVALRIAKFSDGRAYSAARLLRERYGYQGELRAFGDVARDELLGLERVGFDAFALREGEDPQAALAAFGELGELYHASVTQPLPLFRRRLAALSAPLQAF